jgi:hypothetical protein
MCIRTFVRSLGTSECYQSTGDQVLQLGVDDSVFCELSLNTCFCALSLNTVCEDMLGYDRMCEFTHNRTVTQTDHSCTLS